jgi:hypothetical protein
VDFVDRSSREGEARSLAASTAILTSNDGRWASRCAGPCRSTLTPRTRAKGEAAGKRLCMFSTAGRPVSFRRCILPFLVFQIRRRPGSVGTVIAFSSYASEGRPRQTLRASRTRRFHLARSRRVGRGRYAEPDRRDASWTMRIRSSIATLRSPGCRGAGERARGESVVGAWANSKPHGPPHIGAAGTVSPADVGELRCRKCCRRVAAEVATS